MRSATWKPDRWWNSWWIPGGGRLIRVFTGISTRWRIQPRSQLARSAPSRVRWRLLCNAISGITLAQLEDRFLQALKAEPVQPQDVEDIRLTVWYYDSARRYQLLMDPSAYFLNAWLPDSEQMRQRRVVADVLRSPLGPENSALETMFVTANAYLQQGRYAEVQRLLECDRGHPERCFTDRHTGVTISYA